MDWVDEGYVLSARRHGENALIVSLLTRGHGRHVGLVRGGAGTRGRGLYQPGNQVRARWWARLAEHLGNYSCELTRAHAARHLYEPLPLLALSAATTLVDLALPEREPVERLYATLGILLERLGEPGWPAEYVRWELDLLAGLGFGLDLTECAVTGSRNLLAFVSPNTGRAVAAPAAGPYRGRLLPLPGFLLERTADEISNADIVTGLSLTGHFLARHVMGDSRSDLPAARERLVEGLKIASDRRTGPVSRN